MGGYASFPICIAAYILRIKFILYENNLILENQINTYYRMQKKYLSPYKELIGIPKKYDFKIIEIGNIIKKSIIKFFKKKKRRKKILKKLVYLF